MTEETKGAKKTGSRSMRSSMRRCYDAGPRGVHGGGYLRAAGSGATWSPDTRCATNDTGRMTPMVNLSWLPPIFAQTSEGLVGNLGELVGGATVWLAVTGLSRSGKTVFL